MRKKLEEFEVHKDFVVRFTEILDENELDNSIIGPGDEDCILIQVKYDENDEQLIDEISEELDDWEEENL